MRTVRAAVVNAVRDAVRVEPLSLREPRADEVLVRLGASGVCHSDLHVITGDLPMPLPVVLGHEGAGVVEEVGAAVRRVKVGDHVVLSCGGHPRPLVVRDDGRVREIDGGGPLLGLWPGCDWPERTVRLDQGETLFLFTDGVTDIRGETERFGDRRLRELLAAHARLAPAGLLAELGSALGRFGLGAQSDDTAALALRLELAHATKSRLSRNREALRA